MTSITLVTESKLYLKDNQPLYEYFDDYSKMFNFLFRRCVHHLRHKLNGESESRYRTNLMLEFNLTNRMAKAIIRTAKNRLKLLKESARYQFNNLYKRRRTLYKKMGKLKFLLSLSSTSFKQRKLVKLRLFWTQMKLNKVNQLLSNGLKIHLTFGTRHLLKTNKEKFLAKRDNQVVYIGDKNETCGNQQFQIKFNFKYNRFEYKLRVDNRWVQSSNVIEDLVSLDSNKKQEKTKSKDYNRMINSLKFGLFKRCLLSKATKEGVSIHSVNPYNTSKIARASYTDRMKLNVHDAASYVIARRFYQYD